MNQQEALETSFDLIIIGGGPAGTAAASDAAALGKRVALIERDHVGGTCLNRGCIPTKALLYSSSLFEQIGNGATFGISAPEASYDWSGIYDHMESVIATQRKGALQGVKHANITVISGEGVVVGEKTVRVTPTSAEEDAPVAEGAYAPAPYEITGEDIVLAVGGTPVLPPIPGIEHCITSDDMLEQRIPEPESIVIIGGGIIGVEFATFFAQLGIPVTVVEALPSILNTLDPDIAKAHNGQLKKQGVDVRAGHKVVSIEPDGDSFTVSAQNAKDETVTFTAPTVLCAVGRRSLAADAIDESVGVELERGAVVTDERFATSVPGIYALGDAVAGNVQLAHVASEDGHRFIASLYADDLKPEPAIPSCVYTSPEIAQIGDTEASYGEKGGTAVSARVPMGGNARTTIADDPRSFVKLVADAETGILVGASMYSAHATELIDEAAVAIAAGYTIQELIDEVMRPHPTYAESFEDALRALKAKLEK